MEEQIDKFVDLVTKKCGYCNGTGFAPMGPGLEGLGYCKTCHGLGEYDVKEPIVWDTVNFEKFDDTEMTKISIPANHIITDEDINDGINRFFGPGEYLKELNKMIIEDVNERYVRELLNRIHKAIDELNKDSEFSIIRDRDRKIIDILMGVKGDNK